MMNATTWKVGDHYWQAHGSLFGREEIIGEPCESEREAASDADSWLSSLSEREQTNAECWVREWKVTAVNDDGGIDCSETV